MKNNKDQLKVIFITVGTTSFDPLIEVGLSKDFARSICSKFNPDSSSSSSSSPATGIRIVLQIGRGTFSLPSYAVNVKETSKDVSTGQVNSWSFSIELDNEELSLGTSTRQPSLIKKRKRETIASSSTSISYEVYRFKPTLAADFDSSSFVISHAGAGSIFEALRANKPLLVVVNPVLADNHQTELADALSCVEGTGHGPHLRWCMADQVSKEISLFNIKELKPLPRSDLSMFTTALDRILR